MEHSGRSITNVEGQTERPAWADAYLAGVKREYSGDSAADAFVVHGAPMPLDRSGDQTCSNDRAITEELNIMQMEIIRIREQLSQLSQSVHTVPLVNFLGYERDLAAFPNLPMSEEGRPTKAEGLPVDIASYIYMSIRAEALKTDATISLLHGILLTQFLHAMMVPESGDELRALPLGSINKTTLSKSNAQTRQARQATRVARVRRQEQPKEAMEGEDPGQSSTQGLGAQRPSWMDDMMTELSQRMESVFQPTHCIVSDISRRLTALEQKVANMDVGWKKEVTALKEVLKGVATSAELFPLTERVVLIEEHLRHVRHVLKLTDDDDDEQ
ncbi:hypothetical protein CJ030_MR4G023646 [Morella rubra]|uniref:Uncharacterized protein n=1 Tax=Morella rubra TaxID=262757 RepID=A0A6A1VSP1_9ROSI|nr:hypothetical protein CJ030_MR4G023646 [Morella rubra]